MAITQYSELDSWFTQKPEYKYGRPSPLLFPKPTHFASLAQYSRMTTSHDTSTSEDDCLMAQANEQLERELLQSQKLTLITYQAPRRVVSLGISPSYVKDWTPADAFRELYQNWYVLTSLAGQALIHVGRMPSSKDSTLTVRASSHFWKTMVTVSQSLFPTSQGTVRIDAHWVSFSTKKRPVKSRSQIHACNYPSML
jgi:hypothetical protein